MTPDKITPIVRIMIEKLDATHEETYLPLEPEKGAEERDCFPVVQKKVEQCGGRMIMGWQIWETKHLVEAECHAVWEDEDGDLHDITPKPESLKIDRILFVEDGNLIYEEKQIDNIRINKSKINLVDDLIEVCKAIHRFDNKGERAYLYELTDVLNDEQKTHRAYLVELKDCINFMLERGMNKKSLCPCGSTLKFIDCHGYNLRKRIEKDI